jgi:hypothetical protein
MSKDRGVTEAKSRQSRCLISVWAVKGKEDGPLFLDLELFVQVNRLPPGGQGLYSFKLSTLLQQGVSYNASQDCDISELVAELLRHWVEQVATGRPITSMPADDSSPSRVTSQ